jgi:2-amino-4-hydroxy-6-hydroxymethyldihydropteridine diphosphokinase
MAPVRVYLALGSNLGAREAHLGLAREQLGRVPGITVRGASSVEETAPLDGMPQPAYLNQMLSLDTTLSPGELLEVCHRIEALAGRDRRARWESRTLDLDIVRYGELALEEPGLTLPHPGLPHRDFWRRELDELARSGL